MRRRKKGKHKETSTVELTQRVKELEESWKRALADYHNLEKRVGQQQKTFARLASAALIDKLLAVLDDLERAAEHINDNGLNLVLSQFKSVLQSEGVKEIQASQEEFDPQSMDCTDMVEGPQNTVIRVLKKGYTLNGQVIRPAKVEVGSGRNEADPGENQKGNVSERKERLTSSQQ